MKTGEIATAPLFSVVINNYNYARYLRACIDSALAQTWQSLEVIVVDDGSTDDSVLIMKSYGDRIRSICKENGGQGSAINEGFKVSRGEWVIFLDADDKLAADAVYSVMQVAGQGNSCVQYYLEVIASDGRDMGYRLPTRPLQGGDLKPVLARFQYYISPPSSGNAYARDYLKSVLPMPEAEWRIAADAYLILAAPFYGHIATVQRALGYYRRHGGGASDVNKGHESAGLVDFLDKEIAKEQKREVYVKLLLLANKCAEVRPICMPPTYCKYWVLIRRIRCGKILSPDRRSVYVEIFNCAKWWPNYKFKQRLLFVAWGVLVNLMPARFVAWFSNRTLLPHMRTHGNLGALWGSRATKAK